MRKLAVTTFSTLVLLTGHASGALAVPLLQLDIAGGRYDADDQTIVAQSNPFTLYAIGTPGGEATGARAGTVVTDQQLLSETFYISAAVSPQVSQPGLDLGYFTINGQQVAATGDMVYGKPPVEVFGELQGFDTGDLPGHGGIYPTYFTEFAFHFSPNLTTATYDTAVTPGGPSGGSGSFYQEFVVDTSGLNPNYVIHFDLYNERLKRCGAGEQAAVGSSSCVDVDAGVYAPFTHDAQSPPVPEPATIALIGSGLAAGALRRLRRPRNG